MSWNMLRSQRLVPDVATYDLRHSRLQRFLCSGSIPRFSRNITSANTGAEGNEVQPGLVWALFVPGNDKEYAGDAADYRRRPAGFREKIPTLLPWQYEIVSKPDQGNVPGLFSCGRKRTLYSVSHRFFDQGLLPAFCRTRKSHKLFPAIRLRSASSISTSASFSGITGFHPVTALIREMSACWYGTGTTGGSSGISTT